MITLNLEEIFNARSIPNGYSFLVKHGVSPGSARTLIYRQARTLRLDHIEIMCKNLICEPSDLFAYTPETHGSLPESPPLHKLVRNKEEASLKQTISHLSYQELLEIKKIIASKKNTL